MEELSVAIGVSRPTLSRYFNDPKSVRQSTADKIRLGLEQVDYIPNFFATRMNRESTGIVGVIIPYLHDLFFASLLEAIEKTGLRHDFTILTQSSHGDPRLEARAVERFISMNADAIVISPLGMDSDVGALELAASKLPVVFIDSNLPEHLPNVDFVGTDNRQSINIIVDYLCRTGTPPIFFSMPRLNSNSQEREAAYIERMQWHGLQPQVLTHDAIPERWSERWSFESHAYRLMDDYFSRGRYTADTLLCVNDLLAIGVLRAATRHHLTIKPSTGTEGIRVAGHGGYPLSDYMTPSLTTVTQDVTALAEAAIRIVIERVRGESSGQPSRQLFEASLKIQESA
ncbi:MAG TPA: LacI family DNA-binding transcriptional regulator [Thiolinea sp.]|nr:LacI family DNA-binding transcriptional regulator [Thiolinea sp.]